MKKLFLILTIILVAFAINSCNKFLDVQPVSQGIATGSTDSITYKTASEIEAALAGVYSGFKNEYFEQSGQFPD
jgi:TRAP-type uncharacterized transport system substrate-binding protein